MHYITITEEDDQGVRVSRYICPIRFRTFFERAAYEREIKRRLPTPRFYTRRIDIEPVVASY